MLLPIQTEVVFLRWPKVNFVLIGLCCLSFLLVNMAAVVDYDVVQSMVLGGGVITGWIGHVFLHGGLMHLLGNMMFLWVFGNAVNERMGQLRYGLFFLGGTILAAAAHMLLMGGEAIGASGAVNAVVGVYLVLYPSNRVTCFWFFLIRGGTFALPGYLLIGWFFLNDVFMAVNAAEVGVAYWAHLGGLLYGVIVGAVMLRKGWIHLENYDNPDLLTLLKWNAPPPEPAPAPSALHPGEIAFDCPYCHCHLRIHESQLGGSITCWSCKKPIHLEEA